MDPRLDLVDRLSLTREIARQIPEKEKERCVVESVDVVAKASVSNSPCFNVALAAIYLVDNNLRAVQADIGFLVVLPETTYADKASAANKSALRNVK